MYFKQSLNYLHLRNLLTLLLNAKHGLFFFIYVVEPHICTWVTAMQLSVTCSKCHHVFVAVGNGTDFTGGRLHFTSSPECQESAVCRGRRCWAPGQEALLLSGRQPSQRGRCAREVTKELLSDKQVEIVLRGHKSLPHILLTWYWHTSPVTIQSSLRWSSESNEWKWTYPQNQLSFDSPVCLEKPSTVCC
jgi:hypothetical protein